MSALAPHLPQERRDELASRVQHQMPAIIEDLGALTRIPSVSADGFDQAQVQASAEATLALLEAEGVTARIVSAGGRPAVLGEKRGPQGAPTVLLYAHHDVQPPGSPEDWTSAPFEPTQRDGRLYGRGAADDKAGIMAHVAALRVLGDELPVTIRFFIEGEEEIGSDSLPDLLAAHADELASDVIVLADSQNWEVGTPALTTSLRGMFRADITMRTLDHAVHSGMFGGPVPDAILALTRLLASFHDEEGGVAIPGLTRGSASDLEYSLERLRTESGMLPEVADIGSGSILDRLWSAPSITTIGMDVPPIAESSNTLIPMARARVSVRLSPEQDPDEAFKAFSTFVTEHTPFGAQVSLELVDTGPGFIADAIGPNYSDARAAFAAAWGKEPVDMGVGGSIPFVAYFAERFPEATILVTGVEDPDTRAHGANESLHLAEFERVVLAQSLLLDAVGAREKLDS